ncbi:Eco57I restriction-modification methylase domain-containing protein [Patescibacteria group bacterium]
MITKQQKQKIQELVDKFIENRAVNKSEIQVQTHYTVPLLKVLGWKESQLDIDEIQGNTGKFPDIRLYNKVGTLFVIESKTPKEDNLEKDSYIKQLLGYCDAEGIYWGALTNFSKWRVYSSYRKTIYQDKVELYDKHGKVTNKAWKLFSLLSYSFINDKKGRIDDAAVYYPDESDIEHIKTTFFASLVEWRNTLSKHLKGQKGISSQRKADFETQKILDRLIFMKFCFNKKIVSQNHLSSVLHAKKTHKYATLKDKFNDLNLQFDSSLFFHNLCDEVKVKDSIIENTIRGLNAIDFSTLSVHIIGEVYENFIGQVLQKKLGTFYTPEYIVDHMVKTAVEKRISGINEPKELEKITIIDPACGSGSFLIKAFDTIFNKYKILYKGKENIPSDFDIKRTILLKNLYGVDLDEKAVQIAQLNLLLKTLEGTTEIENEEPYLLPDLYLNIRVGNSLISGQNINLTSKFKDEISTLKDEKQAFKNSKNDKIKNKHKKEIDELERYINDHLNKNLKTTFKDFKKHKPFNYELAFYEVFENGGFDIVIGNPPWVSLKGKHKSLTYNEKQLNFFYKEFNSNKTTPNLYEMFVRKSLKILNHKGLFSFIVPDRIAENEQFIALRKLLLENYKIEDLWFRVDFPGVIADTLVFTIKNTKSNDYKIRVSEYPSQSGDLISKKLYTSKEDYRWFYVESNMLKIFNRIFENHLVLELGKLTNNITSGCGPKSSKVHINKESDREIPILKGENIGRYYINSNFWLNFRNENLSGRTKDKNKLGASKKMLMRKTGSDLIATFDDSGMFPEQSLYFIYDLDEDTLQYLTALMNSQIMNTYYRNFAVTNRNSTPQLKQTDLVQFPIIIPKMAMMNEIVINCKKIAKIMKKSQDNKAVKTIQRRIDSLIFKIYNITKATEIELLGSKTKMTGVANKYKEFSNILSRKGQKKFWESITKKERQQIVAGFLKHKEGYRVSAEEENFINSLRV